MELASRPPRFGAGLGIAPRRLMESRAVWKASQQHPGSSVSTAPQRCRAKFGKWGLSFASWLLMSLVGCMSPMADQEGGAKGNGTPPELEWANRDPIEVNILVETGDLVTCDTCAFFLHIGYGTRSPMATFRVQRTGGVNGDPELVDGAMSVAVFYQGPPRLRLEIEDGDELLSTRLQRNDNVPMLLSSSNQILGDHGGFRVYIQGRGNVVRTVSVTHSCPVLRLGVYDPVAAYGEHRSQERTVMAGEPAEFQMRAGQEVSIFSHSDQPRFQRPFHEAVGVHTETVEIPAVACPLDLRLRSVEGLSDAHTLRTTAHYLVGESTAEIPATEPGTVFFGTWPGLLLHRLAFSVRDEDGGAIVGCSHEYDRFEDRSISHAGELTVRCGLGPRLNLELVPSTEIPM